jgi:hypothetical protein
VINDGVTDAEVDDDSSLCDDGEDAEEAEEEDKSIGVRDGDVSE